MARQDRYGDKGSKEDRRALAAGGGSRLRIGAGAVLHRADGSQVAYVETVAGKRQVPGSDTRT